MKTVLTLIKSDLIRILIALLILTSSSCTVQNYEDYQLVIVNASVFNTKTLEVEKNKSVFIQNGLIKKISETDSEHIELKNAIDANERLLTPSFIDVHNHLNFIFGDTVITDPGNFETSRRILTAEYMPYGITVVRSAGGREAHLPMMQSWMEHHPRHIDYYPSGGALVSLDTKFYNHTYVSDSTEVIAKIKEYHKLGIRHIKVYSLIGEQELKSAVRTTGELEMNLFGHIENDLISVEVACKLGLSHFEHAKTFFLEVIKKYEADSTELSHLPPDDNENWRFREYEVFNLIGTEHPSILALIELLKKKNVSVTPTLHLYAHPIGLTSEGLQLKLHDEDRLNWSEEQLNRARIGYEELCALVYKLYENGISLNTGSDTYEPGKTILSEMLLLNESGIPMNEVLRIASLNSAKSIDLDHSYGSIEQGKRAHLILHEENPLTDPLHLLSKKTVIKDGVIW